MNSRKTLLQIRYRDDGLRLTCNQYLEAFPDNYYRVVVFLTGSALENEARPIQAAEIISLELDRKQLKGLRLEARRRLREIIDRYDVTLVLAHRWKATTIAVAALARKPGKEIPVFSVVHALYQMASLSRRLVGRFRLQGRCRFIGVSEAVRRDIMSAGFGLSSEDVLALPNAVDVKATEKKLMEPLAARQSLGVDSDALVCGHVGRLVGAKDQKTLVAAFAKLHKRLPAAHLVIIGDGRLEADLKAQVKSLNIVSAVTFAGALDLAVRLMPAFDIFVLTSVAEGFPRVLLEAMVCRLPIVATDRGGISEVLGASAEFCRAGAVDEISQAMEQALTLDQESHKDLVERGYSRVVESFSNEVFRQRLLSFVEQGQYF